ncbi:hypothetical protein Aph01nite_56440 [Acrocarpospora phusangensis]|uniref:Uncharacterized protein n=1 Tax=Acrocarpospora phusangensis TaxID=1070424 RepID=A0A919UMW9_9ACTN|nr:hypothetical protein [Acrocarpospora phusangensis]GIH27334.1 hypothetical protein Aph01nite_56440 [Acrocarpospora phusangensis]
MSPQQPRTGRTRVRPWPASRGRAAAAQAARERAELARGIRLRSIFLAVMAAVLGASAITVLLGIAALLQETRSRPLTGAERAEYVKQDVARRWHDWPATVVFPEELEYTGLARTQQFARRVGVAPEIPCWAGVDASVASVLNESGCRVLLRSTYVDQSATFAITVGVAVLKDEDARVSAAAKLPVDDRVGVRPVAFPGTVTDRFGAAQRQRSAWVGVGPYIVFVTTGYTDGRTRDSIPPEEALNSEMWPTAQAIGGRVARSLGEEPDVPRCTQGNVC